MSVRSTLRPAGFRASSTCGATVGKFLILLPLTLVQICTQVLYHRLLALILANFVA